MTLRVTQLTRHGQRVQTFEKVYEANGKTKRTGMWRVIHYWQRKYRKRIGRSTVIEILNIRRAS